MEKKTINIVLGIKAQQQLKELKEELDLLTISDVIRSSISLTKFISEEKTKGAEIIIRDKKGNEKIIATLY